MTVPEFPAKYKNQKQKDCQHSVQAALDGDTLVCGACKLPLLWFNVHQLQDLIDSLLLLCR